ncbi:MscL family protein [Patescibacteria group bacterium]|nr:MscL family protein [Patescibacteria group bacterium]MBU4458818.1 MscL family protein [Patescibacteria group bacterium]MCG2696219.1 MscL family protein [Candidatus Portnoybacteria bacterium]
MNVKINEFINFIRSQGVVGLAIGFILGGAVSKVVSALVNDLINPIIGIFLGRLGDLSNLGLHIGSSYIGFGHFISILIDFIIIALVVYYGFKALKLNKVDKKEL